ncbi:alpha/beta hydrolase [Maricaulis sp.]|uniref:alpha/beta hydrolase n=1 Tax=Maricaulis sp. TaxID=1486257 RepID=UPI003A9015BE
MRTVSRHSRLSFRRRRRWPLLAWIGLVPAGLYLAALLLFAFFQDRLIYFPPAQRSAPGEAWISEVPVPTSDGESLIGWYSQAAPGCPTLLFLDGNAGGPAIQSGRWRRLHAHGVGFLGFAWRGYAGSSGQPDEAGLHHDARAGYDWLRARNIAAGDIVVHGFSLGSGPATRLAAERETGALILEAPYFSLLDLMQQKLPLLPVGLLLRNRFRSDVWIGQVEAPVLIVHGDGDRLIPPTQSERLFELAAGAARTRIVMPGSDHATLARDGLYDHVWPFLDAGWGEEGAVPTCSGLAFGAR